MSSPEADLKDEQALAAIFRATCYTLTEAPAAHFDDLVRPSVSGGLVAARFLVFPKGRPTRTLVLCASMLRIGREAERALFIEAWHASGEDATHLHLTKTSGVSEWRRLIDAFLQE